MDGKARQTIGWARPTALLLLTGLLLFSMFRHLSFPLLWNDESFSAMFGQRVVEYGYPKVHGERNVVYGLRQDPSIGVDPENDAYLGSPWGQYYVAALGVVLAAPFDDPYEKTARLRLPFAVAGVGGVGVLIAAILPAFSRGARRYEAAIACVLLVLCSTSLLLHLREVRYYALAVLLSGGVVWLFAQRHIYRALGWGPYSCGLALTLVLLCNTFYPLFGVFGLVLALEAGLRALRSEGEWARRARRLLEDLVPLGVALLGALPTILYLNLFAVTGAFMEMYEGTAQNRYGAVLSTVVLHLLRYEFLGAALLSRASVVWLSHGEATGENMRRRRALASFLFGFCVVYVLVVARTPFFYERYYLVVGPMLTAVVVLDFGSLLALRRRGLLGARWGPVVVVGVLLVSASLRLPEFEGRIREWATPYRGPLDALIPYLLDRFDQPEKLVIATDYEGPALMYYLGSHVTVGYYGANLEEDLAIDPDVIIPRYWPGQKPALARLRSRGGWVRRDFPVAGLPANNVPSLSPRNQASGFTHRFDTVLAERPDQRVFLFERVE